LLTVQQTTYLDRSRSELSIRHLTYQFSLYHNREVTET